MPEVCIRYHVLVRANELHSDSQYNGERISLEHPDSGSVRVLKAGAKGSALSEKWRLKRGAFPF
jgi:hypothetical protein